MNNESKTTNLIKVSLYSPDVKIGNIEYNANEIINKLDNSTNGIVVFPELGLTGYTSQDLFLDPSFVSRAYEELHRIVTTTKYKSIYIIGLPVLFMDRLYNCAAFCYGNKVLGFIPKTYLANFSEFYEKRWFADALHFPKNQKIDFFGEEIRIGHFIFVDKLSKLRIAVEVCQDMWSITSPSNYYALNGANVIINISASPEVLNKSIQRTSCIINHSLQQNSAYIFCSSSSSESVSDIVMSSYKAIAISGSLRKDNKLFDNSALFYDLSIDEIISSRLHNSSYKDELFPKLINITNIGFKYVNNDKYLFEDDFNKSPFKYSNIEYEECIGLLSRALEVKISKLSKFNKVLLGLSGGLDSTLVFLIANQKLPKDQIFAYSLPSENTSKESLDKYEKLVGYFGLESRTIDITESLNTMRKDIDNTDENLTYENIQARIRNQILMNLSNELKGIVLGTSDLSEIALGYYTYGGDQMSMYNILAGVPKTLVKNLINYLYETKYQDFEVLKEIINSPITAELRPNQNTETILGSYDINDFIMYHWLFLNESIEVITSMLNQVLGLTSDEAISYIASFRKRFFQNQFKRQNNPEGIKILKFSLDPRSEFRLPGDVDVF